jgi:ankyrin repeat protein
MTLEELREVLYIEPGQASFRHDRLVNNIENLVPWCGNLVNVDEEDGAVQFAHHTVKQYLCSETGDGDGTGSLSMPRFRIAPEAADHAVGEACVTYLSFTDFQRQLAKPPRPTTSRVTAIAPAAMAEASLAANLRPGVVAAVSSVRRLLQPSPSQQSSPAEIDVLSRLGDHASVAAQEQAMKRQYAFFSYADTFWLHHTTRVTKDSSRTWNLWVQLVLRDERCAALRPATPSGEYGADDEGSGLNQLVDCILHYEQCALLAWLLKTYDLSSAKYGLWRRMLLDGSASAGLIQILGVLLRGLQMNDREMCRAMVLAAREGHVEMVRFFLKSDTDVNRGYYGLKDRTALQAAAEGGHLELVQLLLSEGANVNAQQYGSKNGSSALQAAAAQGLSAVVDELVAAGADVNAMPTALGGRTALQAAAEGGHRAVVERLLQAGAEVNAPPADHDGRTALQAAASAGHLAVVELLLAAGASVNAPLQSLDASSALAAAAQEGHVGVVRRLLLAGADPNQPPSRLGRTALANAAGQGHVAVVEQLLAAGADADQPSPHRRRTTALHAAAAEGHVEVVRKLLEARANPESRSTAEQMTALQWAKAGGHKEVVRLLSSWEAS